jgi:hypothetical protein
MREALASVSMALRRQVNLSYHRWPYETTYFSFLTSIFRELDVICANYPESFAGNGWMMDSGMTCNG